LLASRGDLDHQFQQAGRTSNPGAFQRIPALKSTCLHALVGGVFVAILMRRDQTAETTRPVVKSTRVLPLLPAR
jgi:hypothetical protein